MSVVNPINIEELDADWVHLIMMAREMGISLDEVKAFLKTMTPAVRLEFETT
ncbi:anti-repressor SinI family protein [Paenibacillus sp. TAB 01]|uniref:anti-repressor SinI family protein n=1 Tax=Paenibacillus sp. TAB 01 TaxID=3368988 RepID=UPI0037509335